MGNNYVGINYGGIVGGKGDTIYNANSFRYPQQDDLNSLLSDFQSVIEQDDLSDKKKQDAKEYISTIKEEAEKKEPKKSVIKLTFDSLKELATSEKTLNLIEKLSPIIISLID